MPPSKRIKTSAGASVAPPSTPLCPPNSAKSTHFTPDHDNKENHGTPQKPTKPANNDVTNSNTFDPDDFDLANHDDHDDDELFRTPDRPPHPTPTKPQPKSHAINGGYDALKSFNGQTYTGMAVGGSHTWNYDPGVWRETKEEPDLWKIDYETTKRRAKNAPTGSGAPVGTEYHWVIVAHQYVRKTDANTYTTHLSGSKYKLAHKNASSNTWSIPTVKAQRDQEVEVLEDAKRRVQGLPPVLATEKVKVEMKKEKGQQKLDSLFGKVGGGKRKRSEDVG